MLTYAGLSLLQELRQAYTPTAHPSTESGGGEEGESGQGSDGVGQGSDGLGQGSDGVGGAVAEAGGENAGGESADVC